MSGRLQPWRRAVRGECVKLMSVRSTYLVLGLAMAFGIGVSLLTLMGTVRAWATTSASDRAVFDPVADSFAGFQYAELAFGALGVLAISSEYATGTIQASLRAVPRRGTLYAAKVTVLGVLALVLCQASAFTAFMLGQSILSKRRLDVALGDPGVLRAVFGAGLYLAVVTLVGFGLGALIRHTAGALISLFAVVFLAWPLARASEGVSYRPDHWLLVNAGDALASTHRAVGPHAERTPSWGAAALVVATYLLVFLLAGGWRVSRD